jgi:hypothetical protein
MRRLLPLLALAALTSAASAADMPVKGPLANPYPTTRCGFYYGINAEGGAGVVPNAPAGTTMIAGDIGGLVGYACPIGATPWFAEGIVDFQNLNAGNNGFSLSGPIHLEQRVGVQTPLLQLLPNIGFNVGTQLGTPQSAAAVLPPGATLNGTVQNYVYGAVNEDDISSTIGLAAARRWLVSGEVGTGLLIPFKTAGGTPIVADSYAGYELQSNAMCLGGICPKLGNRYKVGVSFKY